MIGKVVGCIGLIVCISVGELWAQIDTTCLMFYNAENLFYRPKNLSVARYNGRLNRLFQVVAAAGKSNPPALIALAEVENAALLQDFINRTPLRFLPYEYIHQDSKYHRGLDVAIIYRSDVFKPLGNQFIEVYLQQTGRYSRDILYSKLLHLETKDTLHVFVCHWPSRVGGQKASEVNRIYAANLVKSRIDSLCRVNADAKIIITGDLNDEAHNRSQAEVLDVNYKVSPTLSDKWLHNLTALNKGANEGSTVYKGIWYHFDHFIVSTPLLSGGLHTKEGAAWIVSPEFILEYSSAKMGSRPKRSANPAYYKTGYSDHLPVVLQLYFAAE